MLKNKNKTLLPVLAVVILTLVWSPGWGNPRQKKPEPKPQEIPTPAETPEPVAEKNGKYGKYTYTLTPEKEDLPGEYTRQEIESFLCACAPGFIRAEDLYKTGSNGKYLVKPKINADNQIKMVDTYEISKWYEDKVLVTATGALTPLDIDTIKGFYDKINQVIGQKKFVYKPRLEAANIVIELAPPQDKLQVQEYVGETSILQDNLAVRLTSHDQTMSLQIETYKLGSGKLINESRNIVLTPEEMEFRKQNRLVKVYIKNILDPHTRYFAFVHELLHSIGFTGHSPYYESHLFPLPVRAFPDPLPLFRHDAPVLSDFAQRMVEILYRPEILPGMTLKDARDILMHSPPLEKTPPQSIITYLQSRKNQLENQQKNLLAVVSKHYSEKMNLYIDLDKLVNKEQLYLEELQEIRRDYGLDSRVVNEVNDAPTVMAKLIRIRRELIVTESQKKRNEENQMTPGNPTDVRKTKQEIKRLQEELVVLRDLLEAETKVAAMERSIMSTISSPEQKRAEESIRRILRQLFAINDELGRLTPVNPPLMGQ